MADIAWPADLAPFRVGFYLQAHVGGPESPLTRTRKRYGLSAPRWVARMSFRGGYAGVPRLGEAAGFGPRLDSLIADLKGGLNRALLHDFRRPRPVQPQFAGRAILSEGAAEGASAMTVAGFSPGAIAFSAGDYLGGDGRPHIVSLLETVTAGGHVAGAGSVMAGPDGRAIVGFNPPLRAAITPGTALNWPVTGPFLLVSDDAGANEATVGEAVTHVLDFVEDLL